MARSSNPSCANCSGSHTANFSGCLEHPANRHPPNKNATKKTIAKTKSNRVEAPIPIPPPESTPAPAQPNAGLWSQRVKTNLPPTSTQKTLRGGKPATKKVPSAVKTKKTKSSPATGANKVPVAVFSSNDSVDVPCDVASTSPAPTAPVVLAQKDQLVAGNASFADVVGVMRDIAADIDINDFLKLSLLVKENLSKAKTPMDRYFAILFTVHSHFGDIAKGPLPQQ